MSTMSEVVLKAESRAALKDSVFLHVARCIGELGTCDRKHVGAVFVRQGRCISWGFNGAPPGMPHCSENGHGYLVKENGTIWVAPTSNRNDWWEDMDPHHAAENEALARGCKNATHAEANALAFAAREGISVDRTTLYVSVAPCDVCARLLIAAGVSRVVAHEAYRDASGVELLKEAGVVVHTN